MYTGVEPTSYAKKNLNKFNARAVDKFSSKITHVIMNKSKSNLKRTLKLLKALAVSVPNGKK
jgi:hypothetical protein|tara:strand:- start:740 stop:925 length:186 start_codon:yes stop_codon:yes gene_type:complete